MNMESLLISEIYIISALLCLLILVFQGRTVIASTLDQMLRRTAFLFFLSFFCVALIYLWDNAGKELGIAMFSSAHFFIALGIYFWGGYVETLLGRGTFSEKKRGLVTMMLLLPVAALLLINVFLPVVFRINVERCPEYLWGHYALYGYLFVCALPDMISLLKQAGLEGDPQRRSLFRVTACLPLSVCIKALPFVARMDRVLPFSCVLTAIVMLAIFIGRMRAQISIDALTQVNNRHNLMDFMTYKLKNTAGDMCLMMIDIDDFKHINDTYGHLEGDRALKLVASALKRACGPFPKRPYIGRYGGDEFIVVMEGGLEDAERLKTCINNEIGSSTIGSGSEKIRLSLGIALYEPGLSARDWISAADRTLYEVKPRKTSR